LGDTNNQKQINDDNQQEVEVQKDDKDLKIEELENKVKELDNNWKRALADYQNLQKKMAENQLEMIQYGSRNLLIKFLDILDHLEEAQKHLADKGIELVIKLFKDYLKEEGAEEMERLGKIFDPVYDECLDMRNGEKNNIVIEVAKKGYTYKSKVLRVAKVIVEVNK
jgi:molecular chaperone GrpE